MNDFSYTPFATDRDRVRFHIGDVDGDAWMLTNTEIDAIIVEAGGWRAAVILCIDTLIARLSATPDFTADWLKVGVVAQVNGLRRLRDLKVEQLGIGGQSIGAEGVHVYRLDSQQQYPPTYRDGRHAE